MGECAPHTKALAPYSVFSKRVSILVSLPASVFDRVLQLCSVSVFWFSFPSPLSETCPIKLCVFVCVCVWFLFVFLSAARHTIYMFWMSCRVASISSWSNLFFSLSAARSSGKITG